MAVQKNPNWVGYPDQSKKNKSTWTAPDPASKNKSTWTAPSPGDSSAWLAREGIEPSNQRAQVPLPELVNTTPDYADQKLAAARRSQSQMAMHPTDGGANTDTGYQDPYAGLIATLQGRSGTDQAMLAAIYNKAAEYIRGMQGDVSGIYDTAAKDYQAGNQAATNAVNAGVEAARAGQTRQAQALGTADLIGNIAARNEDIGNNQAAATSNLAQLLATNLNANAAGKTNALSNLLLTAQGTQNEGAQSQAAYARALAEKIANYEAQGIQAKNAYNSNMYKADLQAQQAAAKIASNEAIAKLRYSKMTAGDVANASAALMDAGTQMGLTGQALTDYVNNAIGQVRSGG